MQSPRISVRVPPKLLAALEMEADHQGERLTEIVRAALQEYLQRIAEKEGLKQT